MVVTALFSHAEMSMCLLECSSGPGAEQEGEESASGSASSELPRVERHAASRAGVGLGAGDDWFGYFYGCQRDSGRDKATA